MLKCQCACNINLIASHLALYKNIDKCVYVPHNNAKSTMQAFRNILPLLRYETLNEASRILLILSTWEPEVHIVSIN